jgi:uncharacterized protein with HEPN domain
MPPRDPLAFLIDIQCALDEIEKATAGLTLEGYSNTRAIRSRVEREFTILGEAIRQLPDAQPEMEAKITGAGKIIAFRNQPAHAYFAIHDATVWDLVQAHVPVLRREIEAILKDHGGTPT